MLLKLKPFQHLFILFAHLHHLPILFLHIENLYKVGDGDLLGELRAPLVELIGQTYWFRTRNANGIVLGKQNRQCHLVSSGCCHSFSLTEIAQFLINGSLRLLNGWLDKAIRCQLIAFCLWLYKSNLSALFQ